MSNANNSSKKKNRTQKFNRRMLKAKAQFQRNTQKSGGVRKYCHFIEALIPSQN